MSDQYLVLLDTNDGQITNLSWECISLAQRLARETRSVADVLPLGPVDESSQEKLCSLDLNSVLQIDNSKLDRYSPEIYVEAISQVLDQISPVLVLMPHSYRTMDWIPRFATQKSLGLVTDCTGYKVVSDDLMFSRQMFRNKLNVDIRMIAPRPWLVTLQAGSASIDDLQQGSSHIEKISIDLSGVTSSWRVLETVEATKGKVDLAKAETIIGVGRGVKKKENLEMVRELASVLNAELGASRPVVDNEWLERERQIGSSGQNVSPKLYIAVGISGAIQHVVGIRNSSCIVAINSDPYAPIFNLATYGILGDLQEIVPALTQKLAET